MVGTFSVIDATHFRVEELPVMLCHVYATHDTTRFSQYRSRLLRVKAKVIIAPKELDLRWTSRTVSLPSTTPGFYSIWLCHSFHIAGRLLAGATPKRGRNPYRGNPPNPVYQRGRAWLHDH
jgi:hypothetical protein